MEVWLGVSLVDRSTYPTTLTAEGRQFHEVAEEVVRMLQISRFELQSSRQQNRHVISIAALHSLSLTFLPRWLRLVEGRIGTFGTRVLPDSFHNCLQAIVEGGYDFLFTFHHPSIQVPLDPESFPHLVVGHDQLVAVVARSSASAQSGKDAPRSLLNYAPGSFLGRLAALAQSQDGGQVTQVTHTNENSLAEALKFMVMEGHGLAWLPRGLVGAEIDAGLLSVVGPELPMEIRFYRNVERTRSVVDRVWTAAQEMASEG